MLNSRMTISEASKNIEQPLDGYIKTVWLSKMSFDDKQLAYPLENLSHVDIGLAVDYLTRLVNGQNKRDVFDISIQGAYRYCKTLSGENLNTAIYNLKRYYSNLVSLDDISIICACNLVKYDVYYRNAPSDFNPIELHPDELTIQNIRMMVNRTVRFINTFGPIVRSGGQIRSDKARNILGGRYDYVTSDTLWDIKTLMYSPDICNTLQLVLYYLMGLEEGMEEFRGITKLGIYNPRLNEVYTLQVNRISPYLLEELKRNVIGY